MLVFGIEKADLVHHGGNGTSCVRTPAKAKDVDVVAGPPGIHEVGVALLDVRGQTEADRKAQ